MVDTQHFCLRWNNYQSSITSAFENLRDDEDFVDVTLACEGKSLKAHRVVLSACSPYFRELLKSTPCKHPVIVLQDVAFADLHALVEFIYHGEVNVHQRSLTSFLKTAEVLRVSGLTQQAEDREELPPSITRNHQGFSDKLEDVFPSPITASAVAGLRRPGIRRDSEAAGLGSGEFDLSALSKRSKSSSGADDAHNSVMAAAANILQQAAAAAAANQSTPEDFSPKSRRNNEISENNHHPHTDHERNERSPHRGEDVKSEPLESCPNIEVDTEDSVEGREPSSVASGQDETDNSAQGPPPGHFHHSNVQEKLQSLFSAGSSPSQPAFNFNLPVSRQAISEASLSGLANAAGLNQMGPDLGAGSQGFVLPLRGLGYRCEPCGKNLTSPQRLRRHIQNVHAKPVKPPVCNICNKVYSTLNSLRNHKSIYHRAMQRRTIAGDIH